MEIRRFFIKPEDISGKIVEITGDEYIYATRVLRQRVGFTIIVNTGDGFDYVAKITEITKNYLKAEIQNKEENSATPKTNFTLYQGSCKQGKNYFIVQKSVELGVKRIVFFDSEYVVEKDVNLERLQKIAVEAMKQCGRADSMSIEFMSFSDAIKDAKTGVLFFEGECDENIEDIMSEIDVKYFVGSEGGFSKDEIELAKNNGIKTVSLGNRILRAETASVVATTLLQYKCGGLR